MKVAEIKELDTKELKERIQTEEANYRAMLLNHAVAPLENPSSIRTLRRTIARMKTGS